MATLVSPGVSVTITDESFFIPASAPTVPLLFIATADEKLQPDGVTPAEGTEEYDVVRTITSLSQSTHKSGALVGSQLPEIWDSLRRTARILSLLVSSP